MVKGPFYNTNLLSWILLKIVLFCEASWHQINIDERGGDIKSLARWCMTENCLALAVSRRGVLVCRDVV